MSGCHEKDETGQDDEVNDVNAYGSNETAEVEEQVFQEMQQLQLTNRTWLLCLEILPQLLDQLG